MAWSTKGTNLGLSTDAETDTVKLGFIPWFDYGDERYIMNNTGIVSNESTTGVKAVIRMIWTVYNEDGSVNGTQIQDFEFHDQMLDDVVTAQGKKGLRLTLAHFSEMTDLTMTILVKSDCLTEIVSKTYELN